MSRFRKLAVCVAVASLALLLCGCSQSGTFTPAGKSATVSTPAIAKDGVLRVGVDASNPPLAGQTSKIIGVDVDIAAAIADELGLKLEVVDVSENAAAALEKGTVDIALGVDSTNTDASIWKSDAYLQTGVAAFAAKADAGQPTKSSKVAAQDLSRSAWSVTNELGDEALKSEPDLKTCFADLAAGTVDYVAADAIIGTYAAHSANISCSIIAMMQKPGGYCAAVLDTNSKLKSAISDTLAKLVSNGTISVIEKKWLGTSIDLTKVKLTEGAEKLIAAEKEAAEKAKKEAEEKAKKKAEEAEAAEGAEGEEAEGEAPAEGEGAAE